MYVQTDGNMSQLLRELIKHVMDEVDTVNENHAQRGLAEFNDDKVYKEMTAEAIDSKALAIKKMAFFVDSFGEAREDKTLLARIKARPFLDFAHESTMLELQTGSNGFPWEQVRY